MASTSVRFEEYPNKSGIPTFLSSLMSCVITVFSVTGWRKTRFKNGIHSFVSQVISVFYLFYLLFCHTQWITSRIKTIINRLINNKSKICTLLGRSDCGGEISEKPKVRYSAFCLTLKNGLITRLNILKDGAFLMSFGNEFHILGPWNRIENFLIFVLQVWGR